MPGAADIRERRWAQLERVQRRAIREGGTMFEDALFATNHRRTPQQRWAAVMSCAAQAAFVTVIVALPLFFTDALPISIRTITELPSVPRSAGPPASNPVPNTPAHGSTSELVNDQLIFIRVPTGRAKEITDVAPPVQPCVGACVPGSTNTDSATDALMESMIGKPGPVMSLPKSPPVKSVILSHMDEGLLIRKVTPVYPQIAIMARQQGTVLLHAIIARDGTIQQLQAISGPPLLIRAAMEAVGQWRYRPYILNGQPVEVDTQITVNFKLGG
jgi:protein TonB